jgi:hypothetical protein
MKVSRGAVLEMSFMRSMRFVATGGLNFARAQPSTLATLNGAAPPWSGPIDV